MRTIVAVCLLTFVHAANAACSISDIDIKSLKAQFVNECQLSPCIYMKGVAVLTNRCRGPVGVQVKITGYDKSGSPVATRELWPASIRNIPPGDYPFSLDHYLDYDPSIKKFDLTVVEVKQWR